MRVPIKRGLKLPVDWQEQGAIFLHRLAYLENSVVRNSKLFPTNNEDSTQTQISTNEISEKIWFVDGEII